jgi:hypothetical protein
MCPCEELMESLLIRKEVKWLDFVFSLDFLFVICMIVE